MNLMNRVLVAVLPAAVLATGVAYADNHAAKSSTPFLDKLVAGKALEQGEVDAVRKAKEDVKACRADVKAGKAKKGSCLEKMISVQEARLAALGKAKPSDKKHVKAVKKATRWTNKMLRKLKKQAAKWKAKAEKAAKATEKAPEAK